MYYLHQAVHEIFCCVMKEGHYEMAELLLRAEAEVNNKAKNGLTPLHLTAQEDRVDVAKLLVSSVF